MKARTHKYLTIKKCIKLAKSVKGCIEFPAFGARYPDATCIDGQLYDLDQCDGEGRLYEPSEYKACPVCNTREYIQPFLDNEEPVTKIYNHLKFIFTRYGN